MIDNPETIIPPAILPVSMTQLKDHLKIEHDVEDSLLSSLLETATHLVEHWTGRSLIERQLRLLRDQWPDVEGGHIKLPILPASTILQVQVIDYQGNWQDVDILSYYLTHDRLVFVKTPPCPGRPCGGIAITYQAGCGTAGSDCPATLRQAILLLTAQLYQYRDMPGEEALQPFSALLEPFRTWRLT